MKKILQTLAIVIFLCAGSIHLFATEGMWLPQLLETLNEKQMKSQGLKISAKDIYDINKASLKDAIVSFGGFCTAEVISNEGLLLTNHHCGYGSIQNHTTLQNNYLENGFWAMSKSQELPNDGLFVTFIVRIDDVTNIVTKGLRSDMPETERQALIQANIKAANVVAKKESYQECFTKPFFEGNKYYLFVTETYKDVRLVGTPPSSIGKFGSDTDNWVWPRHTGDFSMFRIYADKNNRPAAYSPDNVPYKPKRALSISLDGMKEGDFTMVLGFPGRTQEYLHSAAVAQTLNVMNPARIAIRDRTLKIWDGYMRNDAQIKIQYAAKYASMANAWKKWIGENLGLTKTNGVAKKENYEAEFTKRVNANDNYRSQYGNLLNDLVTNYKAIEQYSLAKNILNETINAVEILGIANKAIGLINAYNKDPQSYEQVKADYLKTAEEFYKDYNVRVDKDVCSSVMAYYLEKMPESMMAASVKNKYAKDATAIEKLYESSAFTSFDKLKSLLNREPAEAVAALKNDAATITANDMVSAYTTNGGVAIQNIQNKIDLLQRTYMKAQMDVFNDKTFYPDANSTLRLSYGKVDGFTPRDAVTYDSYTYLDGVMEKYIPGDYEFDVPAKLIDLYKKKDFGTYAAANGKMPVCFIASNHTTGGNSGSPALDAYGNFIGLNFDRAWEGTMSDINYDPSICRNIMVDARYILFIIDKYAGASHLIKEMTLVHPKKATVKPAYKKQAA